jgi:hypothetical protein
MGVSLKKTRAGQDCFRQNYQDYPGAAVNYCPVCKREYKELRGNQTRHCPVCGSMLVELPADEIEQVRDRNRQKN